MKSKMTKVISIALVTTMIPMATMNIASANSNYGNTSNYNQSEQSSVSISESDRYVDTNGYVAGLRNSLVTKHFEIQGEVDHIITPNGAKLYTRPVAEYYSGDNKTDTDGSQGDFSEFYWHFDSSGPHTFVVVRKDGVSTDEITVNIQMDNYQPSELIITPTDDIQVYNVDINQNDDLVSHVKIGNTEKTFYNLPYEFNINDLTDGSIEIHGIANTKNPDPYDYASRLSYYVMNESTFKIGDDVSDTTSVIAYRATSIRENTLFNVFFQNDVDGISSVNVNGQFNVPEEDSKKVISQSTDYNSLIDGQYAPNSAIPYKVNDYNGTHEQIEVDFDAPDINVNSNDGEFDINVSSDGFGFLTAPAGATFMGHNIGQDGKVNLKVEGEGQIPFFAVDEIGNISKQMLTLTSSQPQEPEIPEELPMTVEVNHIHQSTGDILSTDTELIDTDTTFTHKSIEGYEAITDNIDVDYVSDEHITIDMYYKKVIPATPIEPGIETPEPESPEEPEEEIKQAMEIKINNIHRSTGDLISTNTLSIMGDTTITPDSIEGYEVVSTVNEVTYIDGGLKEINVYYNKVIAATPIEPGIETPKPETPKPETPKPETPKPETPKPELPKPELPKPEMPKPELPKPELPKPQLPKPETPKPETPKPELPKPELPKPELPKPEMPKPELPKPEMPKPERPYEPSIPTKLTREEIMNRIPYTILKGVNMDWNQVIGTVIDKVEVDTTTTGRKDIKIYIGSEEYTSKLEVISLEESRNVKMPNKHWAKDYIERMVQSGYIKGNENGDLNLNGTITLAEANIVLDRILHSADVDYITLPRKLVDLKLTDSNHWSNYSTKSVLSRYNESSLITSDDVVFNKTLNREEVSQLIYDVLKGDERFEPLLKHANKTPYSDQRDITNIEAVKYVSHLGIFIGDDKDNFTPNKSISRAEFMTVMSKLDTIMKRYPAYGSYPTI